MDQIGYQRGLIKYTSENALAHKKSRVLRPRIILYSFLWLMLCGAFFLTLFFRTPLAVDILRDRNALYQEAEHEAIDNVYSLEIMNKDNVPHNYRVNVSGLDGLSIVSNNTTDTVAPGEVLDFPLRVRAKEDALRKPRNKITIQVETPDHSMQTKETTLFWEPMEYTDENHSSHH